MNNKQSGKGHGMVDGQVRVFGASDAPLSGMSVERVAVLGFGNLGRSMALNLRDSGYEVVIGNIEDAYKVEAASEGFRVLDIAGAVRDADVVYILVADEIIPLLFSSICGALRPGSALCFASGYCLAFGLIEVPQDVDILMLAPRMLGQQVRTAYVDGRGYWSYISVEADRSGAAWIRLLSLANACGALRAGALELSAKDEAKLDLMVEQTVGPYFGTAIQLAFAIGLEAGLPAEALVMELYMSGEMSQTFQSFKDEGFYRSVTGHGIVAEFGGYLGTLGIDWEEMQKQFATTLFEIESGAFAQKLQDECANGYPTLTVIEAMTAGGDPMSEAENRVRAWEGHSVLVDGMQNVGAKSEDGRRGLIGG